MNMTRVLIAAITLSVVMAVWAAYRKGYAAGVADGMGLARDEVSSCTIKNAHDGKCLLPCEAYEDCVEKNGHPEVEY